MGEFIDSILFLIPPAIFTVVIMWARFYLASKKYAYPFLKAFAGAYAMVFCPLVFIRALVGPSDLTILSLTNSPITLSNPLGFVVSSCIADGSDSFSGPRLIINFVSGLIQWGFVLFAAEDTFIKIENGKINRKLPAIVELILFGGLYVVFENMTTYMWNARYQTLMQFGKLEGIVFMLSVSLIFPIAFMTNVILLLKDFMADAPR